MELLILITHVGHGPTAPASSGILLEMQVLRLSDTRFAFEQDAQVIRVPVDTCETQL